MPNPVKRLRRAPSAAVPVPSFRRHLPSDASLLSRGGGGEATGGETGHAAVGTSSSPESRATPWLTLPASGADQNVGAIATTSTSGGNAAAVSATGHTLAVAPAAISVVAAGAPVTLDEEMVAAIIGVDTRALPLGIMRTRTEGEARSLVVDAVCQNLQATSEVCYSFVLSFHSWSGCHFDLLLFFQSGPNDPRPELRRGGGCLIRDRAALVIGRGLLVVARKRLHLGQECPGANQAVHGGGRQAGGGCGEAGA